MATWTAKTAPTPATASVSPLAAGVLAAELAEIEALP
jgi:hypothetical protein